MRRVLVSLVAGTVLVLALMVFTETSMAIRPDVVRPVADRPLLQLGDGPAPPLTGRNVSFRGSIDDLPDDPRAGIWKIEVESGEVISVEVTDNAVIMPPGVTPEIGDGVHVLARSEGPEGEETLVALKITVEKAQNRWGRPLHFRGEIESLPEDGTSGVWEVSGYSVTVDAKTMINPRDRTPEVGMVANVVALEQSDGALWAMNIVLQTPGEAGSEVEIEGTIEDLPDHEDFLGVWLVDSTAVSVTTETELKGADPAEGLTAEVKGYEEDGSIIATWIKVEGPEHLMVELEGTLVSTDTLGSEWVIDTDPMTDGGEISVTVTSNTYINTNRGALEIGCSVEIKALEQEDDTLLAIRIRVEDDICQRAEVNFTAEITSLPSPDCDPVYGHWIFDKNPPDTVVVTPHTEIDGEPEVGRSAEVWGFLQQDGYVHAETIEIQEQGE